MSRMHTRETAKETIMNGFKVTETGCCEWIHGTSHGYGMMSYQGKDIKVCRLAYELFFLEGPIPKGACILHKCDNRLCININHLYMGTKGDNIRDRVERDPDSLKGRQKVNSEQLELIKTLSSQGIHKKILAAHFDVDLRTIQRLVSGR